jgi:hypothetical protein
MCGGKIKQIADSGADSVKKGLSQIDPTTKEGLLNISTLGSYGMVKHGMSEMSPEEESPGETESERASADVAAKEYDFAREMDFVQDEYETRVERLGTPEMQNAVVGRANVDAQKQTGAMVNNTEASLSSAGIDPSSGRATTAMTEAEIMTGDAVGNAKSQSAFALDSAHLEGKNNRIGMALGEKTKAVAGLQDIAAGANRLAIDKSKNRFNDNAANASAVGSAVGMGSQAYLGRKEE